MRVLLSSWEYPPVIEGGLARHVRKLAEHLVGEGIEVHVLTRGGGKLPVEEDRNADMYALGAELCERIEFALVHSHDWLVAAAAQRLARGHGLPWLTTVHATEFGRHQGWVDKHPQSHIHAAERSMVWSADGVIT